MFRKSGFFTYKASWLPFCLDSSQLVCQKAIIN